MFKDLRDWLASKTDSLETLEGFQEKCREAILTGAEGAAMLALLAEAAASFVERHAQSPLDSETARRARARLLALLDETIEAANSSAEERLRLLDRTARVYVKIDA